MREKLQNAPWWVWSLIMGVYFGAAMAVFLHMQEPSVWPAAIVGGLVSGVIFGAIMGPLVVRLRRKTSAAAGNLPARDLRIAGQAVMRGPVPLDPDIRQAAARLATLQLKQFSRLRGGFGLLLFGTLTMFSAFHALTDSPWWWVTAALFLALCALYVILPRHLKRRLEILSQDS